MIVKVAVDLKVKQLDRLFDYSVPERLQGIIEIGLRVFVPFGSLKRMGIVIDIDDKSDFSVKDIIEVIDLEPIINKELIQLADYLTVTSSYPRIMYLLAMIPSVLKAKYTKNVKLINKGNVELQPIFNANKMVDFTKLAGEQLTLIKKAIKNDEVQIVNEYKTKEVKKYVSYVSLLNSSEKVTENGKRVIETLQNTQKLELSELLSKASVSLDTIKRLEKKGVIQITKTEKYRDISTLKPLSNKVVTLSSEQQVAFDTIKDKFGKSETCLLYGITGSGKTEIYLNLIEEVVSMGKEAILLVPEISLTPMMVNRFLARFQNNVAIFHSGLSDQTRYDEWRKILRKEVKIVVGARSAIFAPFTNLGIIIIDEEHEQTYKQDDAPKYHAKDVALVRSEYHNAPLVLGSATPSIEAYARAKKGVYSLVTLKNRNGKYGLPKTTLVDMTKEFKSGNKSIISKQLETEIRNKLDLKEQIILLLNRRGYANFMLCRKCGYVVECPNCSVSLNYHEYDHTLKCHYCGYQHRVIETCPKCGGEKLTKMGYGTQKVEEEINRLFPEARIVRMDNDTTRNNGDHERLLYEFEKNGDILLGTQMIAKGLDFWNVTLVGVLCADLSLKIPDFRSKEKTFQLITQVSGRAGRGEKAGSVIIQSYNTDHYAIKHAVNQDYEAFYNQEMKIRKLAKYVPFYYMTQIEFRDIDYAKCLVYANKVKLKLLNVLAKDIIILGPVSPSIMRIQNKYIVRILIKYKVVPNLDTLLTEIYEECVEDNMYVSIDRFPTSF